MKYLYVMDGKYWIEEYPPSRDQIEMVIDGDLTIFRFQGEEDPQVFEPIDYTDTDSWGCV